MNQKDLFDKLADHLGQGGLAALPKTNVRLMIRRVSDAFAEI